MLEKHEDAVLSQLEAEYFEIDAELQDLRMIGFDGRDETPQTLARFEKLSERQYELFGDIDSRRDELGMDHFDPSGY